MSQQSESNSTPITSTEDIATLLEFQEKLLGLVHSELYNEQTVNEDAIVKFQINHVTQMNEAWRKMIQDLQFRLVKQKYPYQSTLRDHFHKVLGVDFLPFLRINKHELTQVSLYGFDIYVEPLSAILEILNRIDGQKHILHKYIKTNTQQLPWAEKMREIWQSIKKGWDEFIYESTLFKISLNAYILKQYLKIAAKSLVKKDKEIIFTGCCNLFTEILPILKTNKEIWLLCELSELNNELYQFHPSFNYSYFYSLMLPLQNEYEPIFRAMKIIGQKCLNTNILTPLLFSILRSREHFHQFIQQVDSKIWEPYLNGLVFGLIYNFKARILEYEEAMEILKQSILKLGILGHLQTQYFVGELGKEWRESRDFFISALKVGYNVGELQTWHPCEFTQIQERILNYTKNSLLMHSKFPHNTPIQLFFQDGFEFELQNCLQELTGSLLNCEQFSNNFSPNIAEAVQINEKSINSLLKLSHLIRLCNLGDNVDCLCYLMSFLNKTEATKSILITQRLNKIGESSCTNAIKKLQKETNRGEDLKEILFTYIQKHRPVEKIHEIIWVCLMISTPKQAIEEILSIVSSQHINNKSSHNLIQLAAANILAVYSPEKLSGSIKLKTFDKEYTTFPEIINMNNKLHSSLSVLVEEAVEKRSAKSIQILLWISRISNWIVIPLLSFPISSGFDRNEPNKKLEQFSIWFIKHPEHHQNLVQLLSLGLRIQEPENKVYFVQISLVSVCEQIIMEINKIIHGLAQLEDNSQYICIIKLLQLFLTIYKQFLIKDLKSNQQLLHKIMKLYLRSLEKLDAVISNSQNQNDIKLIINSFSVLYCPLLDQLLNQSSGLPTRKWRACMWKLCLTSLDINVEHAYHIRQFQLPSIRKDKGFFIKVENEQQIQKEKEIIQVNPQRSKLRVQNLYQQAKKYEKSDTLAPNLEIYEHEEYLLRVFQIKQTHWEEKGEICYKKQYLIPPLTLKMISLILSYCSETSIEFIIDLLAMTLSNHRKLTEWALLNKNKEALQKLGLSKQTVSSFLSQILAILNNEQLESLIGCLDENSKKTISDNFNLMLMKQQQGTLDPAKEQQLIIILSRSLGFLLVYNQSNWRYFNELLNELASPKSSGLANIPSLLLQYLEYIRITVSKNEDYETKVHSYYQLLEAYTNLLHQKYIYLQWMESHSKSKKQNKEQYISSQQIKLFKVNELGYIDTFCLSWNVKDFISRASCLRTEVSHLTADLSKFANIFELLDKIVSVFVKINKIVNYIAKGGVICPDFLNSLEMCSYEAYVSHKIQLGAHIETYYRSIGQKHGQIYTYLPLGSTKQINQYIEMTLSNVENPSQISENVIVQISLKGDQATIKNISAKFEAIKTHLLKSNIIKCDKEIQFNRVEQKSQSKEQSDKANPQQTLNNKIVFYFGLLYRAMQLTNQKVPQTNAILSYAANRQVLNWEIIKSYDAQAYHHIKSVIIDQELQTRKLRFVFNDHPLIPQGDHIEVNKLNRERYCNLVGKFVLGSTMLSWINSFTQGYNNVK